MFRPKSLSTAWIAEPKRGTGVMPSGTVPVFRHSFCLRIIAMMWITLGTHGWETCSDCRTPVIHVPAGENGEGLEAPGRNGESHGKTS